MRYFLATLALAGVLALTFAAAAPAQAADPVAVLQSDAPLEEKSEACRVLAHRGTPESVSVLAALLTDEQLSHMARYALEPMPYPEAGAALRDALGRTQGRLKVGIVGSLALRGDVEAVPDLVALLRDADATVAQAAATALGAMAKPEAEQALLKACQTPDTRIEIRPALCDALLACAEARAAKGQRDEAAALYDALLKVDRAPGPVRVAAFRGALLNRDPRVARPLILSVLQLDDTDAFGAALRIARELPAEAEIAQALAEALPKLPEPRRIRVLDTLGAGDGDAAGEAVLAEAQAGPDAVRVAAVRALTRMAHIPAVDLIAREAGGEDGPVADAARNALAHFPGEAGDAAIRAMLHHDQPRVRAIAVKLVGQGGLDDPLVLLMNAAESDPEAVVRVAALDELQDRVGLDDLPALLRNLVHARSPEELSRLERTLAALADRQRQNTGAIEIREAVYGDLDGGATADVRRPVARVVASGSFSVEASNSLFGDPAPGVVKQLRVNYTDSGVAHSKTVNEGETLYLSEATVPAAVVDAFGAALGEAQGDARLALLRLLGSTGSPKAFDAVCSAAASEDAQVREAALRTLCEWPTAQALPTVLELAGNPPAESWRQPALRGSVRLLGQADAPSAEVASHYARLMDLAKAPADRKLVLSGLARVPHPEAFGLALAQASDPAVKAEALLAATAIAQALGGDARTDEGFFNGSDLAGWQGNAPYWRVEEGAIVGTSAEPIAKNEFIWSGVEVGDFYLVLDVMLDPDAANAGIQFRSEKIDDHGQARGYQADMGRDVWGRLYHEHDRGKLDWTDRAEKAVKPGEWNRYEILAVGPAVWTAINGEVGVACLDPEKGERSGRIALQLHSGPPATARYRIEKLVHHPKVEIAGRTAEQLLAELRIPEK